MRFSHVIVGAGPAGCVMARQLVDHGLGRVLVVDQRDHIAGNCYDYRDESGIVIHRYGPHLFHTDNRRVVDFLRRFAEFEPYQHRVLASLGDRLIPLPFNLDSIEACFDAGAAREIGRALFAEYGEGAHVPVLELLDATAAPLKRLAKFVYDQIFVSYTAKQWGCRPEDVNPEVTARVPIRVSRDDRYFQDSFQEVPRLGYSALFAAMLDHPEIELRLCTPAVSVISLDQASGAIRVFGDPFDGQLIYTGMIDELFGYCYGELPYRSLDLRLEAHRLDRLQPCAVVNYPNAPGYTRITEFKHVHRVSQQARGVTVSMTEFPQPYDRNDPTCDVPFYPIFRRDNQGRYEEYRRLAGKIPNLTLLGRLAEYRYYDMDDVVERSLEIFDSRFLS